MNDVFEPFAFTVAFSVADVVVTFVAAFVVTVGADAAAVVKLTMEPLDVPSEFVAETR